MPLWASFREVVPLPLLAEAVWNSPLNRTIADLDGGEADEQIHRG